MAYAMIIHRAGEPPRDGPWTTDDAAWARHLLVDALTYHAMFLELQLGAEHESVQRVHAKIPEAQSCDVSQGYRVELPTSDTSQDPPTVFQLLAGDDESITQAVASLQRATKQRFGQPWWLPR
jgi:hypothetical protein